MALLDVVTKTSTWSILGVFGTLGIIYLSVSTYLSYRKLSHIRGPWWACVSPLWIFYHAFRGRIYLATHEVIEEYGENSFARIAPDQIVTDDASVNTYMVATKSPFTRGHWFQGMKFDPRVDNVLSLQDEEQHAKLRAQLIPGYSGREVPSLESEIDGRVLDLIDLIRRNYVSQHRALDFSKIAGYFTLDSLTQIAFGRALGFLKEDRDLYDYIRSSTAYFPIMEMGSNHPWILRFLNSRLMRGAAPKPGDKVGFGAIIGFARDTISARYSAHRSKDGDIEKRDMLNAFIKHGLTQQQTESEALILILAGSDSTATSLRSTMLHLLTSPSAYARLVSELDAAARDGRISSPVVTNAEAMALPYLSACIREGLRIYPPFGGLAGRVVPKEGVTLNGVFIPGGTAIALSSYGMMRKKAVFGEDADVFRPERWLEADQDRLKVMEGVWELTFSKGRAACLGKGIALMELRKAFVALLSNFEFVIVNPFNAMQTKINSVAIQEGFMLRATERNRNKV